LISYRDAFVVISTSSVYIVKPGTLNAVPDDLHHLTASDSR
jgi:hypothetical protein